MLFSNQPLVVCWGMGQDSTGMLVGMWECGMKPKLIITDDVGSDTFQFLRQLGRLIAIKRAIG